MLVALASHHLVLRGPSPLRNKRPPFAPSGFPRDQRSYEGLRLLSRPQQPCSSPSLHCRLDPIHRHRSPRLPCMHFQTCRPRRPRRSVDQTTAVVSSDPCGLRPILRSSAAGFATFEAHLCGSFHLRPACSTPCLLPTPPCSDAVGMVFGGEQPNSADGTLTRLAPSFAGAPRFAH